MRVIMERTQRTLGSEATRCAGFERSGRRFVVGAPSTFQARMKSVSVSIHYAQLIGIAATEHEFAWQAALVLTSKYHRLDDDLWANWRQSPNGISAVGADHKKKDDTVIFFSRPLDASLTSGVVLSDVNQVIEFIMATEPAIANAVGSDTDGDEVQ